MSGVSAAVHVLFVLLSSATIVWAIRADRKHYLLLWVASFAAGLLFELRNVDAVTNAAPLFVIYNPSWMLRVSQIPVSVIVGWPAIAVIGVSVGMYANRGPGLFMRALQWPFYALLYAALVELVCVVTGAWEWVAVTPELRRIGMAVGVATIATVVLVGAILVAIAECALGIRNREANEE